MKYRFFHIPAQTPECWSDERKALVIVSAKVIATLASSPLLDGPAARGRQDADAPRVAETMTKVELNRFLAEQGSVSIDRQFVAGY